MQNNQKRKPKYSFFSCVVWLYKFIWKEDRGIILWTALSIPITVILPLLGVYFPVVVISLLSNKTDFSKIVFFVLFFLTLEMMFSIVSSICESYIDTWGHYIMGHLDFKLSEYKRRRDYYLSIVPEVIKKDRLASEATMHNLTYGVAFFVNFSQFIVSIINFFIYGTILGTMNIGIVLLLLIECLVHCYMNKWESNCNFCDQDKREDINSKIYYISRRISDEAVFGKEIRFFSWQNYIKKKIEELFSEYINEQTKVENRNIVNTLVGFIISFFRDGLSYLYLIYQAFKGDINAAQFILLFSSIGMVSWRLGEIVGSFSKLKLGSMQISDYREVFDINGNMNHGKGREIPKKAFSIEFKDVSFKFPGEKDEKKVLNHISFKIKAGEKIGIVGMNGVGKSTLIMMMCGLYIPNEGEILIDNHNITDYNRDDLYSLFSLVPQNYSLLPVSIKENITCVSDENIDERKLFKCIRDVGLLPKIEELPKGIETLINSHVNEGGIDLSGGESLKIILARSLYKNSKGIILDEPTANLDPIAESKVYSDFENIAKDRTMIFISHRLASTHFVDRILMLKDGRIIEDGSHDELIKYNGLYKKIFDIQKDNYGEIVDEVLG